MDFDYNIKNYNINELEDIFDLPNGYNIELLINRENKLKQSIINNNEIKNNKEKIIDFITEAKNLISHQLNLNTSEIKNLQNSLQKNFNAGFNTSSTLNPSKIISEGSNVLIARENSHYVSTHQGSFYPGTINPLSVGILTRSLNIDTRFRDNYYSTQSSNFHFDLPIKITKVVSMQLQALELPSTIYTVSKIFRNNFFGISVNDMDILIIIIPDGDYTSTSLQTFLNYKMSTFSDNPDPNLQLLSYILFTVDLIENSSITDGSGSGKMIVSINQSYKEEPFNFSLKFSIAEDGQDDKINPLPLKFGWIMGFREGVYINNVNYISEGLVDLTGPRYLYLVVDDYNNSVTDGFVGAFNSSIINKNILARISLQGGASILSYVSQNNLALITHPRQYFGPVDILKLQIQLLDNYGRIINLSNMDFSMCIYFQVIYSI